MADKETVSIVLTFNDPDSDNWIKLEEDDDFAATGHFFKVFVPGNNEYYLRTSDDDPILYHTNVPMDVEDEDVSFALSQEGTLSYHPTEIVDWEWLGKDPGVTPRFSGRTVTLGEEVVGILRISYKTKFDRYKQPGIEIKTLIVGVSGDEQDSLTLEDTDSNNTYAIRVRNKCTGDPVEGAAVTLDGVYRGLTDSDGLVYVGTLSIGNHHVWVTKDGYIPSDEDALDNDIIQITS